MTQYLQINVPGMFHSTHHIAQRVESVGYRTLDLRVLYAAHSSLDFSFMLYRYHSGLDLSRLERVFAHVRDTNIRLEPKGGLVNTLRPGNLVANIFSSMSAKVRRAAV